MSVRLTDPVRPVDPMRRLQERFPHACTWSGRAPASSGSAAAQLPERLRGRDDLDVAEEFVRARPRAPAEPRRSASCWPSAAAPPGGPRCRGEAARACRVTAFGPFAGTARSTSTRSAATACSCCTGPPGRARRRARRGRLRALRHRARRPRRGQAAALRPRRRRASRTEVRCELTLGGRRLRVVRRPEQQPAQEARRGLDHRAGAGCAASRRDGEPGPPVEHPHRRGLRSTSRGCSG